MIVFLGRCSLTYQTSAQATGRRGALVEASLHDSFPSKSGYYYRPEELVVRELVVSNSLFGGFPSALPKPTNKEGKKKHEGSLNSYPLEAS